MSEIERDNADEGRERESRDIGNKKKIDQDELDGKTALREMGSKLKKKSETKEDGNWREEERL